MQNTQNFNLPLLHQNQAMKEVVINEAITKLDGLLNNSILAEIENLPQAVQNSQLYLLMPSTNVELATYANHLAFYNNHKWEFIPPREGMIFFLKSRNKFMLFSQNKWSAIN
jgi:hypothetical protein